MEKECRERVRWIRGEVEGGCVEDQKRFCCWVIGQGIGEGVEGCGGREGVDEGEGFGLPGYV